MKKPIIKDKLGNKLQVGDLIKRNGTKYKVVHIGYEDRDKPCIGIMPVPEIKFLNSGKTLEYLRNNSNYNFKDTYETDFRKI